MSRLGGNVVDRPAPAVLTALMEKIRAAVVTASPGAAAAGLRIAHNWIEADMGRGKSGIFHTGARVTSSAPGETPAIQSGDLLEGIEVDEIESIRELGAVLSGSGDHADIEIGNARIAPRPFLRPSVPENRKAVVKAIGNELRKGLVAGL